VSNFTSWFLGSLLGLPLSLLVLIGIVAAYTLYRLGKEDR